MRKPLAFGPYLPDIPPTGPILTKAENVYPGSGGYGPVGSYAAQTDVLPYAFGGGGAFIASDGTAYLIAGTDGGVYKLNSSTWTLLTASAAGRWKFAQYVSTVVGNSVVVGVNGGTTKLINLTAGTGSDLAGAPTGTSIGVVGPFTIIGGAGGDKLKVQWSAFDDYTGWTPAVNQSGFQGMHDGGEVMGIASGEFGVILQRFALVRMSLTGDALQPFQFQQITNNFGCASKASVTQAGREVFFLSDRGFIALDNGLQTRPIGNQKVDDSFRAAVSPQDYERLHTAVDPKRTLVMWGIPGTPGTIWCYHWVLDEWSIIKTPFAGFFSGFQSNVTLEAVSALYPNLDTMPYSLDDARFQGGDPRLYFIGSDQSAGALTGPSLDATLITGWQEPFAGKRTRYRAVWPISDATDGVTVTVDARQRMGDDPLPFASGNMQGSGRVPLRASGRYATITVQHVAGSVWTYTQGVELEAEAAGER